MTRTAVVFAALALLVGCARASAPAYTFTELAYPGATSTVAAGINDAGHVVGWYRSGDRTLGFVYKDGAYSSIEFPGAVLTQLNSVNAGGEMTGAYRMPEETHRFAYHGFVLNGAGEFREIAHPEYAYSMAMRVLADGTVIGCYHNDDIPSMHAMTIPAAAFTPAGVAPESVEILDRPTSMHNDATPDGAIMVGILMDSGRSYVVERGAFRMLEAPDAKKTEAWGVNASGAIVGAFVDAESIGHAFVLDDGQFTPLDVPGAKSAVAYSINGRGDIVGALETPAGERRGYLARRR